MFYAFVVLLHIEIFMNILVYERNYTYGLRPCRIRIEGKGEATP